MELSLYVIKWQMKECSDKRAVSNCYWCYKVVVNLNSCSVIKIKMADDELFVIGKDLNKTKRFCKVIRVIVHTQIKMLIQRQKRAYF